MKEQCSQTVFGERCDSWTCRKNAVVNRDGKPYCKIHNPEYIKARDIKQRAKWDAEMAKERAMWHREALIKGIFVGIDTTVIEKNAHIYKSAPDLYEACKFFIERNASEYGNLDRGIGTATEAGKAFLAARHALAKANEEVR